MGRKNHIEAAIIVGCGGAAAFTVCPIGGIK